MDLRLSGPSALWEVTKSFRIPFVCPLLAFGATCWLNAPRIRQRDVPDTSGTELPFQPTLKLSSGYLPLQYEGVDHLISAGLSKWWDGTTRRDASIFALYQYFSVWNDQSLTFGNIFSHIFFANPVIPSADTHPPEHPSTRKLKNNPSTRKLKNNPTTRIFFQRGDPYIWKYVIELFIQADSK